MIWRLGLQTDRASPIGDIKRHVYEMSLFFEVADIR